MGFVDIRVSFFLSLFFFGRGFGKRRGGGECPPPCSGGHCYADPGVGWRGG